MHGARRDPLRVRSPRVHLLVPGQDSHLRCIIGPSPRWAPHPDRVNDPGEPTAARKAAGRPAPVRGRQPACRRPPARHSALPPPRAPSCRSPVERTARSAPPASRAATIISMSGRGTPPACSASVRSAIARRLRGSSRKSSSAAKVPPLPPTARSTASKSRASGVASDEEAVEQLRAVTQLHTLDEPALEHLRLEAIHAQMGELVHHHAPLLVSAAPWSAMSIALSRKRV